MALSIAIMAVLTSTVTGLETPPSDGSVFPGDGAIGTGGAHFHDPTIIDYKGKYFCFHTSGNSFGAMDVSDNLKDWKRVGPVLPESPEWVAKRYRHKSIWAPDILVLGDKLRMYYCASNFGTNQSVIGLAECEHFDPLNPQKGWIDKGLVIESKTGQDVFNAIDAETIIDTEGRHWMFFGSYFGGIYVVELDPVSGLLRHPETPPLLVARNTGERGNPLEGSAICRRGDYYYLFVSYGLAAQGVRSTYRIMVGRSKNVTGPFVDAGGTSMGEGGHVNVLKGSPPMFSPGHSDVLMDHTGRWLMPYHLYDGRHYWADGKWGLPTLQVRELLWSTDGWPLPGLPVQYDTRPRPAKTLIGKWTHQVDFGEPSEVEFRADGTLRNGEQSGRWEQKGDHLTLRWPRADAPGEFWVDELQVAYENGYYVGRNQTGLVIRGARKGR